jgi:peptidoglycan/LPS O-acetylase OafA/YrhL
MRRAPAPRTAVAPEHEVVSAATQRSGWHRFLDRFSRRTSSGRFIPEVDGLRFVAIGLVVVFHLDDYVGRTITGGDPGTGGVDFAGRYLPNGNRGVQLFFVLSGFILALPFARHFLGASQRPSTLGYYRRRLTRLEPPYVVAMCGLAVAAVALGTLDGSQAIRHLTASLGYVHTIVFGAPSRINGVAWTLEVEVQFYLLAPLLAFVFAVPSRLHRRAVLGVAAVAAAVLQIAFLDAEATRASLSLLNFIQYFLVGFLFADVYLTDWSESPIRDSRRWDLVALIGWPVLVFLDLSANVARLVLPALLFVLFCATFRGSAARGAFRLHVLTTIGGMCYTIYLLHYPLLSILHRATGDVPVEDYETALVMQFAIFVPLLLAVSAGFFLAVERPCMDPGWVGRVRRRFAAGDR